LGDLREGGDGSIPKGGASTITRSAGATAPDVSKES